MNSLSLRDLPDAEYIAFPDRPAAWGALAGRGVAHRRSAIRRPALFRGVVRDFQSEGDEQAPPGAQQAHREPQPLDVMQMVERRQALRAVLPLALMAVAQRVLLSAAPLELVAESE